LLIAINYQLKASGDPASTLQATNAAILALLYASICCSFASVPKSRDVSSADAINTTHGAPLAFYSGSTVLLSHPYVPDNHEPSRADTDLCPQDENVVCKSGDGVGGGIC